MLSWRGDAAANTTAIVSLSTKLSRSTSRLDCGLEPVEPLLMHYALEARFDFPLGRPDRAGVDGWATRPEPYPPGESVTNRTKQNETKLSSGAVAFLGETRRKFRGALPGVRHETSVCMKFFLQQDQILV